MQTAPFHWDGDQPDMTAVMVLDAERMSAVGFSRAESVEALSDYLDALPLPAGSIVERESVARGRALFEGAARCASCHEGAGLTNGETMDVGTGGRFQVPSLRGVWLRAPFFHDGCAPTLSDALTGSCSGTDGHGGAATLSESERADLIAYLRSR